MPAAPAVYRLSAATALHRGDRLYQQDQVQVLVHAKVGGCALALVADGMGGKSGGRKAADQVVLTARQLFERYSPRDDDPAELLRQLVQEAHLMIKLAAIAAEEEPHSTLAAFLILPGLRCDIVHAGDSRIYHFRDGALLARSRDHSYVQRLIDEGTLSEDEAQVHPQSNLLTGCLGTEQEPPLALAQLGSLAIGDVVLACSDGLWHYFTPAELAAAVQPLPPRAAAELLVGQARERARGAGDNLSLAIVKVEPSPL